MALAAGPEAPPGKLVVRTIGLLLAGALEAQVPEAGTIVPGHGRSVAVGRAKDCDTDGAPVSIDARGCAVSSGLIDGAVMPGMSSSGAWWTRAG